ncbi:hypothetical protein [Pantoea sp. JV6]|uniref:hypothetical protein n=1 Tax=Pantoea TaxID=53335 RepID=UPI00222082AC|nr:hypothetical protein [Pantoea sp. JV6]MCW0976975.1 hypothetical protein [Pantoea sp. JV6]
MSELLPGKIAYAPYPAQRYLPMAAHEHGLRIPEQYNRPFNVRRHGQITERKITDNIRQPPVKEKWRFALG